MSPEPFDDAQGRRDSVERELLVEIEHLSRLVADQQRAVADAVDEVRRSHATLGWRAQLRFDKIGARLLRNRVLREPYRMVRRAFEIWVDHGFADIFRFATRKIGSATRGRSLIVDDHTWEPPAPDEYQRWLARNTPTQEAYAAMRNAASAFPASPLVSVLIAVGSSDPQPLRRSTESLHAQVYPSWELCTGPSYDEAFHASRGAIIAFVNEGDALAAEALFEVVKRFNDDPSADVIYADHDLIDAAGHRSDPFFKPGWDPELLLSTNILGPFTAVRRTLVERAGGLRPEMGAGQSYDLMLRASEQAAGISHVAMVLSHLGPREMTSAAILSHHAAREVPAAPRRGAGY